MASGGIRVEGLKPAIKQLEAFGASKAEIVDINVRAARTIADAAEPNIPVYNGTHNKKTGKRYFYKTGGALKRSLRVSKAKGYASVILGNARVPYANPIHWGWFYDKNNFVDKNILPNRFLKKALDANYEKVIREYDSRIQALLNKYGVGNK
jgi:hypothetical protein